MCGDVSEAPVLELHLDAETRRVLDRCGFESIPFQALVDRLMAGGLDPAKNRLPGPIALPDEGSLSALDALGEAERERLAAIGRPALEQGQVAAVILNGGMATRFGGVAKGAATAIDGRSFLDLKLSQIARAGQGRVTALLMNSFATEEATAAHLGTLELGCPVRAFNQMVSLRLTPEGALFLGEDGRPSLHATGHGDFPFALRRSGELERLRAEGVRWLTLSNVDNLGASLDPVILGAHIAGGRPMTVELVRTRAGDVGGFPAVVDGRLTIVEAFRAPEGFDARSAPVFNTNTFVFDLEALDRAWDLSWFAVQKQVEGRTAVQFERLVGQLTDFLDATWLVVPRDGAACRFLAIKAPSDLITQADAIRAVLRAQGVLA